MAYENDSAKVAAGASTVAAIAAALAFINTRKVAGAQPVIPDEVVQLIVALAATSEDIKATVHQILEALGAGGQGWPANTDSITGLRVAITPATGVQLPSIVVPSGMALVITAWPLNPAWLFVGPTLAEAGNINQSYPLLPAANVSYFIENADEIYVSAMTPGGVATAGCFACLTVEQRRRGGGV
jgi:hypothetical protein